MPITINWLDADKTIIRYEFEGHWTWTDLHDAIKQVNSMLESVVHPVYVIIDVSKGSVVPSGAISQMRMGNMNPASNWAGGVFVGMSTFLRTLISTFGRVYPKMGERYIVANSMDEALQIIKQKRSSE